MKFAKIVLVTILALIFFTGCTQMQQKTGGTSASPVLDRIQARGELVVGTMGNMPPLNMTSKDGEIFGLEPDLAGLLAKAMGVKVLCYQAFQRIAAGASKRAGRHGFVRHDHHP